MTFAKTANQSVAISRCASASDRKRLAVKMRPPAPTADAGGGSGKRRGREMTFKDQF
jgi:hypothetical protein